MEPYVSTTALPYSLPETLAAFDAIGINRVELGYCSDTGIDVSELIQGYDFEYAAHNYFLPESDEFIINLASQTRELRRRSIEYICNSLDFCSENGIKTYTFHAGFRVDPTLSLDFSTATMPSYQTSLQTFFESLEEVREYAMSKDIHIAIENNVVSEENTLDGESKLLFSRAEEIDQFLTMLPEEVGILLDTGHLNVSAATFDFDRIAVIEEISPHVEWVHIHDNDGVKDRHNPPYSESWVFDVYNDVLAPEVPVTIEATFENRTDLQSYIQEVW
jgi:sugar phosphate isomerase/epimerase